MHLKCENPPSPTSDRPSGLSAYSDRPLGTVHLLQTVHLGCPLGQVQELPYDNPEIKVFILVWSTITLIVSTMRPYWMA